MIRSGPASTFRPQKYQEFQAPQKIFEILATPKKHPHSYPKKIEKIKTKHEVVNINFLSTFHFTQSFNNHLPNFRHSDHFCSILKLCA